jgi:hypothetical protein
MGFWIALFVCIAGLVIYAISNNGKAQALAKDAFWVGLLVVLLELSNHIPAR